MAYIQSDNSTDVLRIDPVTAAARVTLYSSDGHEGSHSLPILINSNSATALNEFILPSLDSDHYRFLSFQLAGTWVGTVIFEGSNNNTTFYPIATTDPSGNATGQTTASDNRIVKVPVLTKYIRARVSAYTSGAISATVYGYVDENSSGLISTLGTMTLSAETTKKIGNVGIEGGGGTASYHKIISTTGLNSTLVEPNSTKLTILHLVNSVATLRYFKLYNKASAPVVGTDIPFITVALSPNESSTFTLPALVGIDFSIGLSYGITLGVADNNTTPDAVEAAVTGMIAYA